MPEQAFQQSSQGDEPAVVFIIMIIIFLIKKSDISQNAWTIFWHKTLGGALDRGFLSNPMIPQDTEYASHADGGAPRHSAGRG